MIPATIEHVDRLAELRAAVRDIERRLEQHDEREANISAETASSWRSVLADPEAAAQARATSAQRRAVLVDALEGARAEVGQAERVKLAEGLLAKRQRLVETFDRRVGKLDRLNDSIAEFAAAFVDVVDDGAEDIIAAQVPDTFLGPEGWVVTEGIVRSRIDAIESLRNVCEILMRQRSGGAWQYKPDVPMMVREETLVDTVEAQRTGLLSAFDICYREELSVLDSAMAIEGEQQ